MIDRNVSQWLFLLPKNRKEKQMSEETATEISTPQETIETTPQEVVQNETVETTPQETTTDEIVSAENETEKEQIITEEPKNINYEDRFKETQAAYTKSQQELKQLSEKVEQLTATPQVVEPTGEISPAVIQQYARQLAVDELNIYRNAIVQLDPEVQADAISLLNSYQASGNQQFLNQAKEFYGTAFVGEVERNKTIKALEIEKNLNSEKEKYSSAIKQKFFEGIKSEAPRAFGYSDKESKYYSPKLAEAIGNSTGYTPAEVEESIKEIEAKAIERYKDDLALQSKLQKEQKKLSPPSGGLTQTKQETSTKSLAQMSDDELEALIK